MTRLLRCYFKPLLVVMALAGILLLVVPDSAWARAGGGGGYSGGGSSYGGGGSSSGGGDGFIIYLLFRFTLQYPYIGIPLIIGFLYLSAKGSGKANTYRMGRGIASGNALQHTVHRAEAMDKISGHDPNFSEEVLQARVKSAFFKLQNAWCSQDLSSVRHFVSDGIYERFSLQLAEQKQLGVRDEMSDIQVHSMQEAQILSDASFDTVTLRINASAVDQKVSVKTGKVIEGSSESESFIEYWSFLRRPTAKSIAGQGLMEGNCPNCGVALEINAGAKCGSCGSLIRSGEYDWVLAEITQGCEWQAREPADTPGVEQLRRRDPGFSVQHLEDRASVMFWRTMLSWREGKDSALRKVATEEFCQSFIARFGRDEKGFRHYPGNVAVGSVDTLGIVLGGGDVNDKALVQIRWSSRKYAAARDGKLKRTASASVATHIFLLERSATAGSDAGASLSSAHCPGCGAAVQRSEAPACEYCGRVLNDASGDWVLTGLYAPYDQEAVELRRALSVGSSSEESGPTLGGAESAAWMIQVMLADGVIDPKERQLIDDFAAKRSVAKEQVEALIQALQAGALEAPMPKDQDEAKLWIGHMAEMALADGFISGEEETCLLAIGKKLGFSAYDIKLLIGKTRKQLFQRAKRIAIEARKRGSKG